MEQTADADLKYLTVARQRDRIQGDEASCILANNVDSCFVQIGPLLLRNRRRQRDGFSNSFVCRRDPDTASLRPSGDNAGGGAAGRLKAVCTHRNPGMPDSAIASGAAV